MTNPLSGSPPPPSGNLAGTPAQVPSRSELRAQPLQGLRIGAQVQVVSARSVGQDMLEVQLRTADANKSQGLTVRAQLVDTGPGQLPRLLGDGAVAGTSGGPTTQGPLRAEVVAVSPRLTLKLIGPTDGAPSAAGRESPVLESRAWVGQQLRQHWPGAQPLTSTLESITTRLTEPNDLARALQASDPAVRAAVQQALERMISQISTPQDLTNAKQLSSTLAGSGIWLEAALAQLAAGQSASRDPQTDLKAQLLTLAQRLRTAISTMPRTGGDVSLPQYARATGPAQTSPAPATAASLPPGAPRAVASDAPARASEAPLRGSEQLPARGQGQPSAALPQAQTATARASQSQVVTAASRAELIYHAAGVSETPSGKRPSWASEPANRAAADPQGAQLTTPGDREVRGLVREVDGMLKQIVTSQLKALDQPQGQLHWALEIPFKTPSGLIALETDIRRESSSGNPGEDAWSMRLNLDLPHLGPLTIKLSLRSDRLSASLQAEHQLGAETLTENLPKLRAQLESRDIAVAALHAGQRPQERSEQPFEAPLISEEA
ncbi:flagellar hook-length control protein FliK [Thiorhodococcus minor]|uniref:Flagellar hook-length control protein-like C-terminal domain-containing protein n=1 Tax=Thiorhodococcus minor TaxID=57489 RepID=A0A6M0JTF1_9GAMM|nr:flagellar hook-length control protein FliK [Thiorhodococcus minor]NEV60519.1 hypothetical protein [Thiorhodococcus minor]